jgi:hypothetical protein
MLSGSLTFSLLSPQNLADPYFFPKSTFSSSLAEPHHFDAAPVAPAPALLYIYQATVKFLTANFFHVRPPKLADYWY